MIFEFDADVFRWEGDSGASWFFAAVPKEASAEIREVQAPRPGFGSVRVIATIGSSEWRTSIFPSKELGAYLLPVKKAVRVAAGIPDGGRTRVGLHVLDV